MDRDHFEAELRRDGYEVRDGEIKPHEHREAHTHAFDVRFLVLDGTITVVFGQDRRDYGAGDACSVPADTLHEEHTGKDGVRYLIGRRPAPSASAAE